MEDQNAVPRLGMTIKDACAAAGIGRTSIFQAIREGKLQVRKAGRRNIVLTEDLRAFLHRLPVRQSTV